ncbi:MAG: hypothetical protein LQ339_001820 [Xanthoria mediterranea]|nr:MAG: hypothetical protein LQ339_001820 [Xanthoria mediterranea]
MVSPPSAPDAPSFPFEKLPTELQLMIIEYAMPSNGLRPQSVLCPLRSLWNLTDKLQSRTDKELWYNQHERRRLPTALFYTNKWLSSAALAITYHHLPFYINIYPWGIMYHPRTLLFGHHFRSHLNFQQLPQFKSLRHYRLNIMHDANWYDDNSDKHHGNRYVRFREICEVFKEQLRFVSDSLSANDNLQSLYISIPCLCCLANSGTGVMEACSKTLDFLTPLQRLRVAKPVVLEAVHDNGFDGLEGDVWLNTCSEPECQHLAEFARKSLHHLDGKLISQEEERWKELKAMDRGDDARRSHESRISLHGLWTRLNHIQDTDRNATRRGVEDRLKRDFKRCAVCAEVSMQQDLGASARA